MEVLAFGKCLTQVGGHRTDGAVSQSVRNVHVVVGVARRVLKARERATKSILAGGYPAVTRP
jgi:hypothetical protein